MEKLALQYSIERYHELLGIAGDPLPPEAIVENLRIEESYGKRRVLAYGTSGYPDRGWGRRLDAPPGALLTVRIAGFRFGKRDDPAFFFSVLSPAEVEAAKRDGEVFYPPVQRGAVLRDLCVDGFVPESGEPFALVGNYALVIVPSAGASSNGLRTGDRVDLRVEREFYHTGFAEALPRPGAEGL